MIDHDPNKLGMLVEILLGNDIEHWLGKASGHARKAFGKTVTACSIINAKCGLCDQDCSFCAQSVHHGVNSPEYDLLDQHSILLAAHHAEEDGASRFSIVTSGYEVKGDELKEICQTVEQIRRKTSLLVCASLGVLNATALKNLKDSGLSRYHHNLESCEEYYPKICTTRTWRKNFETVVTAREQGLETCSGGIFGLGESLQHRAQLLLELEALAPDGIPINFLLPIPGTPLEHVASIFCDEAIAIVCASRIALPDREIILCGGRAGALANRQWEAFDAGATGLMIGDYLTIKGNTAADDLRMVYLRGYKIKSEEQRP